MASVRGICLVVICLCEILLLPRTTFGQTTAIPGGLSKGETPQIIILAFQGRLQPGTSGALGKVFQSSWTINNPNGCPMTGTFFVGDKDTDYIYVKEWYEYGLEIGMYSKTIDGTNEYWRTITSYDMDDEVGGMKKLLKDNGIKDVFGYRNPSFFAAGDTQFTSLVKNDVLYDSTLQIMRRSHAAEGYWPTKMTDVWGHKCESSVCPTNIYPDLWEIPIVTLVTSQGTAVSTAEASGLTDTANSVFEILWNNYKGYRDGNKAPFIINLTPSWLIGATAPVRIQGILEFLNKTSVEDKAYVISMKQMLDWVMNPTPIASLNSFASWDCDASKKNRQGTGGTGGGGTNTHTGPCTHGQDSGYENLERFFEPRKVYWVPVDYKNLPRHERIRFFYTKELLDNYEPPTSSALQFSRQTFLYPLVLLVIYTLL